MGIESNVVVEGSGRELVTVNNVTLNYLFIDYGLPKKDV